MKVVSDSRSSKWIDQLQEQKQKQKRNSRKKSNSSDVDNFCLFRLWDRFSAVGGFIYRPPKERISEALSRKHYPVSVVNSFSPIFCQNFLSQTRIEYFDSPFPSYWVFPKSLNLVSSSSWDKEEDTHKQKKRSKKHQESKTEKQKSKLKPESSTQNLKEGLSDLNNSFGLRVLVFFHGTASLIQDSLPFLSFMSVVFSCLVIGVEYPGYSLTHRKKKANVQFVNKWAEEFIRSIALGENATNVVAKATHCLFRLPFRFRDIFIIGHSIGTAAALHLGSTFPELGGIVLLSPLTNLKKFVLNHCGWVLNIPLCFFRERIDNVKLAASVRIPILGFCFGDDTDSPSSMAFDVLSAARMSPYRLLIEVKHRPHTFSLNREAYMLVPSFSLFFRLTREKARNNEASHNHNRNRNNHQTGFVQAFVDSPFLVKPKVEQIQEKKAKIEFEKQLLRSFQQFNKRTERKQRQTQEKKKQEAWARQKPSTETPKNNEKKNLLDFENSPLTQYAPHFGPTKHIEKIQRQFDRDTRHWKQVCAIVGITCICLVIFVVSLVLVKKKKQKKSIQKRKSREAQIKNNQQVKNARAHPHGAPEQK